MKYSYFQSPSSRMKKTTFERSSNMFEHHLFFKVNNTESQNKIQGPVLNKEDLGENPERIVYHAF